MRAPLCGFGSERFFVGLTARLRYATLHRFTRDESGSYGLAAAVLIPALIGAAGLGTEASLWFYTQKSMLSAADSAAVSAATAASDVVVESRGVAAAYGFVHGTGGVTVTVNQPPTSGAYTTSAKAVEVIVTQPQTRVFSSMFSSDAAVLTARAVAVPYTGGAGCALALDRTANPAVTIKGSAQLNLVNCSLYDDSSGSSALNVSGSATLAAQDVYVVGGISGSSNITTTDGTKTGVTPLADPYANVTASTPTWCDDSNLMVKNTATLSPGVYCGGISFNAGATVTLNPGVYFMDRGSFTVAGNATITGSDVTIVFTSSTGSNWATASISSNANVTLSAPTTGSMAGIVLYGDRRMPAGTSFSLTGGGTQNFGGAVYLPKADLSFSGGNGTTTTCTQIVADTLTFVGNTSVKVDCSSFGTQPMGNQTAQLTE